MNDLYESFDYHNLNFEYIGPTKDVSFYEYMGSKDLFDKIRNNQISLIDPQEKQKLFLNKLNSVKIGKKTSNKKKSDYQS